MNFITNYLKRKDQGPFITVVSGLPRSGTSMMMKMLDAGGLTPLTDHLREADIENPNGYYEYERVKQLRSGDKEWLVDAQGRVVKIISALLEHLPPDYSYRIIFMQRRMDEILASQRQMLIRSGKPADQATDDLLARKYHQHLSQVESWLRKQPNMRVLYVDYNRLLEQSGAYIPQIKAFLGDQLDLEKMVVVIDPSLYRQRV